MRKNLFSADSNTDRIYLHSANTGTIINSFSSPVTNPQGLAFVNQRDIALINTSGIVFHMSGVSNTVLNSFTVPGTNATGLTFDGRNLISGDATTQRIYKFSGMSQTVIDSFSSISTNPTGLTFEGQNLVSADSAADRIYRHSGFSTTVLTSFSSPSTTPAGLAFDSRNLLHGDSNTDRIYQFSGISSTITTSFSSVSTVPTGLAFESTISSIDCIKLNNADLLAVYNKNQGGANYDAVAKRFDISAGTWGSEVSIDANNTGYTHPAVVQLASNASIPNRIICAFRDKAAGTINIFKSDDNGATFATVTTITADLDENNKISLARSGNNILISYHRGRICYSRKSTDNGGTWGAEVTIKTSAVHCDLSVLDTGAFIAAYEHQDIATNNFGKIYISSSADGSSWGLASSSVMSSATEEYSMPTTTIEDGGLIHVVAHENKNRDLRIVKSSDKTGTAWGTVQLMNPLPNQGHTILATANRGFYNPTLERFAGTLLTLFESWDGANGHLSAIKTHAWRNVTESTPYRDCYYPILGLPDKVTSFVLTTAAGTGAESGGVLTLTTTSSVDSRLYKRTINNVRTTSGVKARFKVEIDSGGSTATEACIFRAQLSDGTNHIQTTLRFSTTAFSVMDGNKTDAWGALQWQARTWSEFSDTVAKNVVHGLTDDHEFLLAMKNSAVSIWYRNTHDRGIKWISAVEGTEISKSGVDTDSFLEFGIVKNAATMKVHSLEFVESEDGLYDGFSNPDDLVQRLTATGSKPQFLKDGVTITWGGSDGVVDDLWTIGSAFTFPKEDMVTDSPSDLVRTEDDGSEHVYVFDAGENKIFNVDQINLVGINFRTGKFQMNAADSWGSPTIDQAFTVRSEVSGTVTGVTQNTVTDSSLALKLNQLARPNRPMYLRPTSGTASGKTYKIESNNATEIKITTASLTTDGLASSDTFVVFVDRVSQQIADTSLRYARLVIDAQETADDFYKIGKLVFGKKIALSKNFNVGYKFSQAPNVGVNTSSRGGQKFSTKRGESRQAFQLNFTHKTSAFTDEIEQFLEATDWANNPFVFILDDDDLQNFVLARLSNVYNKQHVITNIFNINNLVLEEEL